MFFVFKQKTAYEMRISDWSSDVCSSDLDLEGISLYDLGGGKGYLVISSQGNNSYAVYDRQGANAYRGSFAVVADGAAGIDGISETDGLDVSSGNLGPGFEHGAMVAQDGRNVLPGDTQNFKIVRWSDIAAALKLEQRRSEEHTSEECVSTGRTRW